MKSVLAAIAFFFFVLSFVVAAPSLSAQKSSTAAHTQPVSVSVPSIPSPALSSALNDLDRVSSATEADLANMGDGSEKTDRSWKNGWRFWHPFGSTARSPHDEQAAASLQRNLHDAMPGLIQNARTSGSFAASFKLYNNLSVVCELLDALVKSSRSQGGKADTALANDSAAMSRIRQDLATYVEQTAVSMDARTQNTVTASTPATTKAPKKIVVDDTVPVKKSAVKKTATTQQ
jgi:hypothetical protein